MPFDCSPPRSKIFRFVAQMKGLSSSCACGRWPFLCGPAKENLPVVSTLPVIDSSGIVEEKVIYSTGGCCSLLLRRSILQPAE